MFYLRGRRPEWAWDHTYDIDTCRTTALHDAVEAGNDRVVEFLSRTGFDFGVMDMYGQTALDLSQKLGKIKARKSMIAAKNRRDVVAGASEETLANDPSRTRNSQITTFLKQQTSRRELMFSSQKGNDDLPPGWQKIDTSNETRIYQETSIADAPADSLTFIKPYASLLQSRHLPLGQRKPLEAGKTRRNPGDVEMHYLNPLHFLHVPEEGLETVKSATEPTFSDEWYEAEVWKTMEPQ